MRAKFHLIQVSGVLLLGTSASAATPFSFVSVATAASPELKPQESSKPSLAAQLRWGRLDPNSETTALVDALHRLFEQESNKPNFAKRELISLLEQALPRRLSQLFPFRPVHKIPEPFFFENFGRWGFLVGELNLRVPPILSGTGTADWIELRSPEPVPTARELTPPTSIVQGLRALSTQNPWSGEIFSTAWSQPFEIAAAMVEYGGLKCWNKALPKKQYENLGEPAQHTRCGGPLKSLTQEAGLPKQLPKKLGSGQPAAPASVAQSPAPLSCLPMGELNTQSLELMGDDKAGHCLLWRNSRDERFQHRATNSKLICLNARHKSFQKTRFNAVVAVLPSSQPDTVHILESDDGLLSAHRLSFATLTATKENVTVPSGQNLRSTAFPRQRTGLYACQQAGNSTPQPFNSLDVSNVKMDWVYIDEAIYSGLRAPRAETDVAWRMRESNDGQVEVERLSWSQLQYDHPSITSERPFACITGREVDAKCGLRVLQTAMQLSEEWLSGEFDRNNVPPAIQLATTLLIGQSLEKLLIQLPDWSLRSETAELLNVYSQKARQLVETKIAGPGTLNLLRYAKPFPQPQRYVDLPPDSQDYLDIKKLLSSSADFWALLKQKSL